MKLFKSMILCSVGALMTLFSGCSDWLDVNVDPEIPQPEMRPMIHDWHILNFIPTVPLSLLLGVPVCLWAIGHAIMTAALIGACLIGVLRPVPLPLPTNGGSVELL